MKADKKQEKMAKKQQDRKKQLLGNKTQVKKQPAVKKEKPANNKPQQNHNRLEAMPTIASMLATPKEQRLSRVLQVMPNVMPFIGSYIHKKQGSRVVQLLVKWGDEDIRQSILDALRPSWKEMIRGKYSIFVLKQLVRYFNFPEIISQAVTMQGIKEAAGVLEVYVKHTANGKQVEEIKKAFRDLSESEDSQDHETLDNIVMKIIEKQYHQFAMSKYVMMIALKGLVQIERDKVLEYLIPKSLELINDSDGLRLFCQVVNYSTSKDRKTIVKEFKPQIGNILDSSNHNSYIGILKLLHTIDDTVLLQKSIIQPMEPFFQKLYESKKIANIIYSLFSPVKNNFNVMGKWQSTVHYTTSKKSTENRATEIRNMIIDKVMEAIKMKPLEETLVDENVCKLAISLVRYIILDNFSTQRFEFVKEIVNIFLADTKKNIIKDKQVFESSLICHPEAHRVIKMCISLLQSAPAEAQGFLTKAISKLQDYLLKNIEKTLMARSSYVLIAIMEATNSKENVISVIRSNNIKLDSVVGANIYMNA